MIRIVDVSEYQGSVAWSRVKVGGVAGGIHKATQYRVDNQHAANHQAIPAAGLPHGCYHFLNFDQPGNSQARFYLQAAGDFGPGTFPPIVDFERDWGSGKLPSPAQLEAFLSLLPAGRRPLLYGNRGELATLGTRFIGRVDVWLADYGLNDGRANGDPDVMRHITQFPAADVKMWQFTSVGKVDGVSGSCDVSMWLGTQAELDAYVLKSQPLPQPAPSQFEEDDMLCFTDATGIYRCDPDGAVYAFDTHGNPGGRYLGGLNIHPSWQAGKGQPNGAPFIFGPTPEGGYVITTRDAGGGFHPYAFPPDGSLAKT